MQGSKASGALAPRRRNDQRGRMRFTTETDNRELLGIGSQHGGISAHVGWFERKTNDKFKREHRRQADTQAFQRDHLQCAWIHGISFVDCDALHPFQEARCWIASQGGSRSADHLHPASVSGSRVSDIFEHDSLRNYSAQRRFRNYAHQSSGLDAATERWNASENI